MVELALDGGQSCVQLAQSDCHSVHVGLQRPLPLVQAGQRLLEMITQHTLPVLVSLKLVCAVSEHVDQRQNRIPDVLVPLTIPHDRYN